MSDILPATAILEIEMEEPKPILVGNYCEADNRIFNNPQRGRVYSVDGICPTIDTRCDIEPKIMEEPKIMRIGSYSPSSACNAKVLDVDGICPTLLDHKGAEPAIVEPCIIGYTRDDKGNVQSYHEKEIAGTLHTSNGSGGNTDQFVKEQVIGSMQANAMRGSIDGVSPCLTEAMGTGGGQIPMVTERLSRKYDITFKEMPDGNIHAFRANDPKKSTAPEWQITNAENIHPTLTTSHEPKALVRHRIRKLTPRECFRLMDVDDADIDKIESYRIKTTLKDGTVKEKPIPKSQQYKLAGNSIVCSCLYHIFYQMFIAEPPSPTPKQLSLFD